MAAMTGFLRSLRLIPRGASPSGSARLGRPWAIAFRSAPAQKSPWSPNRTPTSAASSRSNASKASVSASAVARSTAFRTSGRFKTMVVTGPPFSTRTSMAEASAIDPTAAASPDGYQESQWIQRHRIISHSEQLELLGADEAPQPLQQLHHRPGVALAVGQQSLTQARALLGAHRVPGEHQPLQLDARRLPFIDLEIALGEARHERGQHVLDAEAAAEVGMVQVVADHGQQVDQLRADCVELACQVRHRLRQVLQALPLEALRSEEHTSELQSRLRLVCSVLLEKTKKHTGRYNHD